MPIQIISNLVISSLIFSLIGITYSGKSSLAHTKHHQAVIKQEKKKHSQHHNQMHPQTKIQQAALPYNSVNLPPTLAESILFLMIANPFLLYLLKGKMYNHE